ncbi:hypothetical protein ACP4OV_010086 [Aristida adscensionis]
MAGAPHPRPHTPEAGELKSRAGGHGDRSLLIPSLVPRRRSGQISRFCSWRCDFAPRPFLEHCEPSLQGRLYGPIISTCPETTATHGNSIIRELGRKSKIRETVVPDPDYRLPIVILGIAGGFAYADNLLAAAPVGLLGLLLLFQTTRVRFVFDNEALEVKIGDQLEEGGENVLKFCELGAVVATVSNLGVLQRDPNKSRRTSALLSCDIQWAATI